ncbi:hypothetical protein MKX64_17485 [Paenibacillus sp. FSL M8-0334]|uniref:Uncharacterized protein n=1 Tax=Paenibacillus campinasensis TaxID=66347 RepID=A0ABW9SZD2_9BACL|nr:hypothetical protein [Paenibacillus campinasensis]MUG65666.1 hypothetical protein [Paenibacillus campinasensis]
MNWHMLLSIVLLVSLVNGIRRIRKLHAMRDMLVFLTIWGLAVITMLGDALEMPGMRPLDWIKAVMQPISAWMP